MDHVRRIVVGLGSNLGDRRGNLIAAVDALRADRDLRVLRRSPIYETPPAGGPPQDDYLNAAVLLATSLDARALLQRLMLVERALGRERPDPVRWGPRTIDLDILAWGIGTELGRTIRASEPGGIDVPHPRVGERHFALAPLADLVGEDAQVPGVGRIGDALARVRAQPLELVSERW